MVRLEPETSPRIPPQGYPWWPTELAQLVLGQYLIRSPYVLMMTNKPSKHIKSQTLAKIPRIHIGSCIKMIIDYIKCWLIRDYDIVST